MKIFVTVGFERKPFDRLVKIIDQGIMEGKLPWSTFIQAGYSQYTPKNCRYRHFLEFEDMIQEVKYSDIIISHGGVGTIVLCLNQGKIPILFPRDPRYQEHVDDHQLDFCRVMDKHKKALVAYDGHTLLETVANYHSLLGVFDHRRIKPNSNSLSLYLDSLLWNSGARKSS